MSDDIQDDIIDLYFWTTPNGFKISIMLEELGLPYREHLIDIQQRRAVRAGVFENLAEQPDSRDRRSRWARWSAARDF